MYAVIRTGGKQHRVEKGERIKVDRLEGDVGSKIQLDDILMIGGDEAPKIGKPVLEGAKVTGTIVKQGLGDKILAFKRQKRRGFHKTIGHRQPFTEIEITGIQG